MLEAASLQTAMDMIPDHGINPGRSKAGSSLQLRGYCFTITLSFYQYLMITGHKLAHHLITIQNTKTTYHL